MKIDQAKTRDNVFMERSASIPTRTSAFSSDLRSEISYLPVNNLMPYRHQARKIFNNEEIENLSVTIKEHGIRQPLTVLRSDKGDAAFEVISGERRLRAAKLLGMKHVPCIVVEDIEKAEEIALIENIQRTDLHPLELAQALKKLVDRFGWGGQKCIHSKVGLSRSQISELLKLTSLTQDLQEKILEINFRGRGKFRKLLSIESNEEKMRFVCGDELMIAKKGLSDEKSVLRISFLKHEIKVQKDSLKHLDQEQKDMLKLQLRMLIDEIN